MMNTKNHRFWFVAASTIVLSLFTVACTTDDIDDDGTDTLNDTSTEDDATDTETDEDEPIYPGSCVVDDAWQCNEYYGEDWDKQSVVDICEILGQAGLTTFYTEDHCPPDPEAHCDRYKPDDPGKSFMIMYYKPESGDQSKCTNAGGTYVNL